MSLYVPDTNICLYFLRDSLVRPLPVGDYFVSAITQIELLAKPGLSSAERQDIEGFHGALQRIDEEVGRWLERLDPARDLLILTADHGCDPTTPGTDHTREHVPLLAAFDGHGGRRHDGPFADVGASVLRWLSGRRADQMPGTPFL